LNIDAGALPYETLEHNMMIMTNRNMQRSATLRTRSGQLMAAGA
jgi:hypothetical protein